MQFGKLKSRLYKNVLDNNFTEHVGDFGKSIKPRRRERFGKGNAEICTPKS